MKKTIKILLAILVMAILAFTVVACENTCQTDGHKWEDVEATKEATCTEVGKMLQKCSVCGETQTIDIPMIDHDWDDGVIDPEPTCSEAGTKTYTCLSCTTTKTEPVSATGKHALQHHAKQPADCNNTGVEEYWQCTECNKMFSDANATKEISEPVVIPVTHDYEGQDYIPDAENPGKHYQECSICEAKSESVACSYGSYTNGGDQHSRTCADCGYVETTDHDFTGTPVHNGDDAHVYTCVADGCDATMTEECDEFVENGICGKCGNVYEAVDVTVTAHFHKPESWMELAAYVYYDNGNVKVLGDWPGTTDGFVEDDGWYTITFDIPAQYVGSDAYVIFNDNKADGALQTEDIAIIANEIWVSNRGLVAYLTKDEALEEEVEPVPTADMWFITSGGTETTSSWDDVFTEENNYKLTRSFAAGYQFKVKKNVAGWDDQIGHNSSKWSISKSDSVSGNVSLLLSASEYGDFVVKYACTMEITFNPADNSIAMVVTAATGLPNDSGASADQWIVVGATNGTNWVEETTNSAFIFTYDSATGTYSLRFSFKSGDEWQVKKNKSGDWSGQLGGSKISGVTFADGLTPQDDLFKGTGDITVKYDCTVVITLNSSATEMSIYVESVTVSQVNEYTYKIHVYVPTTANVSKLQVHVWGALGGTDWNTGEMTKDTEHAGWYTYTVTSLTQKTGTFSLIIHNGETKYAVFNDGAGTGPAITVATDMYFIYNNNQQVFSSREAAETAAGVKTVQAATVPVKYDYAA